jgi:hypothetical protein
MTDESKYRITLGELERSVRVATEHMVEEVDAESRSEPDPRDEEPDRGWFVAGG